MERKVEEQKKEQDLLVMPVMPPNPPTNSKPKINFGNQGGVHRSDTLTSTIQSIMSRLPMNSFARSEMTEFKDDATSIPARELTNMAKVMWELPKTCFDLHERGLNAKDSGRYLIRPNLNENSFVVYCDFLRDRTIVHFEDSLEDSEKNFEACEGLACSSITYAYGASASQIVALKNEMRFCEQKIEIDCSSS